MLARSQTFRWCCYGYLAGVVIGSFFRATVIADAIVLLIVVLIVSWIKRSFLFLLLLMICAAVGFAHIRFSFPQPDQRHIAFYNENAVEWLGIVSEEPDLRLDQQKLTVKSRWRRENNTWQPISGKVLVTTGLYPRQKYGDLLHITCLLKTPPVADDFNYKNYLARYEIYSLCFDRAPQTVAGAQGNSLKQRILQWKEDLVRR